MQVQLELGFAKKLTKSQEAEHRKCPGRHKEYRLVKMGCPHGTGTGVTPQPVAGLRATAQHKTPNSVQVFTHPHLSCLAKSCEGRSMVPIPGYAG